MTQSTEKFHKWIILIKVGNNQKTFFKKVSKFEIWKTIFNLKCKEQQKIKCSMFTLAILTIWNNVTYVALENVSIFQKYI